MALDNKLGLTSTAELDREEERISKKKAAQLFDRKLLDTFDVGTFAGLAAIHMLLLLQKIVPQLLIALSAAVESEITRTGTGSKCTMGI